MRVQIIRKVDVTPAECAAVWARVRLSEHGADEGAIRSWDQSGYENSMYVVHLARPGSVSTPFGLVVAAGEKIAEVTWWIDSQYRDMGYGSAMIDELAQVLKARGVSGVHARVLGIHSEKSQALYHRLSLHFSANAA